MASISVSNIKNKSCSVKLTSLDTSWGGGNRTAKYYFKTDSYPTESNYSKKVTATISGHPSSGGSASVSGLSANTKYYCSCFVYSGTTLLSTIKTTFSTKPTVSVSSFTVTQTATGTKKAKVSFSGSNLSGGYYYIYVSGYCKAEGSLTSNSKTITISFDYFQDYAVELEVDNYNQYISKSRTISIEDYDLTPTGLSTTRIDGGFKFSWRGASDAEYHKIKLTRNYDSYQTTKTVYSKNATFTGLEYGVAYTVGVRSYESSSNYGNWEFNDTATTTPAQPRFTATSKNGIITINYNLADSSNVSYVYINLYDSSNSTLLQEKTLTSSSGSFKYAKVDDGKYYIRAQSVFANNGVYLYCVDEDGSRYTLTKSITVSSRPSSFSWTYSKTSGNDFNLRATEWNSFTNKINEFREWKGLNDYTFTTAVKGNTLTAAMFNQAVNAINAMYNTDPLSSVSKGNTVTAYILNNIVSVLNNVSE